MSTPKVFISYRREDCQGTAGHLHEKLEGHFGPENVFFDVDSIPIGRNFVEYLDEQVSRCDVLLAVIGKGWLEAKDENGAYRLQDENDFVRIEVTSALKRDNIRVVPVLVEGAKIPKTSALPPRMEELSLLNAAYVRPGRDFRRDVNDLIKALEGVSTATIDKIANRMVEHNKVRGKLIVDWYPDSLKGKRIWSDGAFLEIGEKFPPAIEEMIKTATGKQEMTCGTRSFIINLESKPVDEWSEAEIQGGLTKSGNVILMSKITKKSIILFTLYADYIKERFPKSKLLVKDSVSPIIVTINGKICAVVMPLSGT